MMKAFRRIVFYLSTLYFILSAVKWFLGEPENTLLESFWDVVPMTYVHYGIPLLIIAIALSVVLKALMKKSVDRFEDIFSSTFLVCIFIAYMLSGIISNLIYCVNYVFTMLFAIIGTWVYRGNYNFLISGEYKEYAKKVIVGVVAFAFSRLIYYPSELYLNNVDEFLNSYGSFTIVLVTGFVGVIGLLVLCILSMPKTWVRISGLFLVALSILGYVQATFLNGKLDSMNGESQAWSQVKIIINLIIWLVIIGAVIVIGFKARAAEKIFNIVCIYICLIQAVTLGYLAITSDTSQNDTLAAFTTEGSLEISGGDNILVFILDMFDSSVMQEIIDEDSGFVEPLADFTFYRNATSQSGHTYTAIPYLLTGTEWESGLDVPEYQEYAYSNSTFLQDISAMGYDLGVYTTSKYVGSDECNIISNYREDVKASSDWLTTLNVMWRTSMYNVCPFAVKGQYTYYSSDITSMVDTSKIWNIDNDLPFYNSLVGEGLSIDSDIDGAFRFYHMRGDHEPAYLSEDLQYEGTGRTLSLKSQAKGCLKIVYEYIKQLKELGKYDDATIIITADHGKIVKYDEANSRPDDTSLPIMMVKLPNTQNDSMIISDTPVSQKIIVDTINASVGNDEYDVGDGETERTYVDVIEDYYMIQYKVTGDANDINNWSAVSVVYE